MASRADRHFRLTPRLRALFDGLLLGGAGIHRATERANPFFAITEREKNAAWFDLIQNELRLAGVEHSRYPGRIERIRTRAYPDLIPFFERFYEKTWKGRQKRIPRDIDLTPLALAHFFAGRGHLVSQGYAIFFSTHAFPLADVEYLVNRLRAEYGLHARVMLQRHYPIIRLSRSGDRLRLRELLLPYLPECFHAKIQVRQSRPISGTSASRCYAHALLTWADVRAIRERAATGEIYPMIAEDYHVSPEHIGRIARGESWLEPTTIPLRRKRPLRRLTDAEIREIIRRLDARESTHAIGRAMKIPQPRVFWVKKRFG
jgi:hypothetical protein